MLRRLFQTKITSEEAFLKELLKGDFNEEALEEALKSKAVKLNYQDKDGNTYLHYCIKEGKTKAIKWLLDHNIKVDLYNKENKNPLHIAIDKGNKQIIEDLLKLEKINIDEKDKNGRTILQELVVNGKNNIAKLLVEYGANINSLDKHNRNVIYDALSYGDENFILWLLSLEQDIELNNKDSNLNTVLHHPEAMKNDAIAAKLIERGADPTIKNAKGESFLCKTALRGAEATKLIDIAIEYGADINSKSANDNTIFMEVMNAFAKLSPDEKERRKNLLEISKHIILKGADVNSINNENETTLFNAVRIHDMELIAFLLSSGIDPNIKNVHGQTAFCEVVYKGIKYLDVLLLMLEYGADATIKNSDEKTLYEIINSIILYTHNKKQLEDEWLVDKIDMHGQYMVVLKEILEQNQKNLNFYDTHGNPLFFEPLLWDDYQTFRLYIKNGLNVHLINKAGQNIFYAYVNKVFEDDRLDIEFQSNLSRLLGLKVNNNFQDGIGWTVVHKILGTKCNEKLFDILTKMVRFDYKIVDKLGRSVIHNAIWNNKPNIIRKIHLIDQDVINIADIYNMLPITYAALLGSQEFVLLFIKLNSDLSSGKSVPPQAVKKFTPMLKNLPKIKVNIDDESILLKINSLIEQTKKSFDMLY